MIVNILIGPGWNVKLALRTKNVRRVKESFPYFKKNFIAKQFMLGLRGTVPKWFIVLTFIINITAILYVILGIIHIILLSEITAKILGIMRNVLWLLIGFKSFYHATSAIYGDKFRRGM